MAKMKNLLAGIFLAALVAFSPVAAAAGKDKDVAPKAKQTNAPIVIEADEIYFSDLTGTMFAKGTVIITQDKTRLTGDLIRGNAKQNQIWIDDKAKYQEPNADLIGSQINYNYGSKTGTIAAATGKIEKNFVTGEKIQLLPGEYIIHNGTITGCNAKVPDYHVSATRVEIWPDDRMIAYNAKFWIKNKLIYTMGKYQKSLKKDAASEFPSVGYTDNDGFYIRQHLEYPFNEKLSAHTDLAWYGKRGFRPLFGINDRENGYTLGVIYGYSIDGNDHWIKREPEFSITFDQRQLFKLPVKYSVWGTYGHWDDFTTASWQKTLGVYFSGDPIKFSPSLNLYLGTGMTRTWQSYNSSLANTYYYDATLEKIWSPKLSAYLGWHYRQNMSNLFAYDRPELAREGDFGFSYQIDRLNKVKLAWVYDIGYSRLYDADLTWSHNLHCWQADITYRFKRSQLKIMFATKKF
jgi:lipopolysaccharide export system protein LptA